MNNKTFYYSYSPTEKQEIEAIKNKYQPSEDEDLVLQIKKLDKRAENSCAIFSVFFGLVSTLIFGAGLSLCLSMKIYYQGTILGIIGLAGMGLTPFLNERIKQVVKNKYAKKIVGLCDEYLKNNNHQAG